MRNRGIDRIAPCDHRSVSTASPLIILILRLTTSDDLIVIVVTSRHPEKVNPTDPSDPIERDRAPCVRTYVRTCIRACVRACVCACIFFPNLRFGYTKSYKEKNLPIRWSCVCTRQQERNQLCINGLLLLDQDQLVDFSNKKK